MHYWYLGFGRGGVQLSGIVKYPEVAVAAGLIQADQIQTAREQNDFIKVRTRLN